MNNRKVSEWESFVTEKGDFRRPVSVDNFIVPTNLYVEKEDNCQHEKFCKGTDEYKPIECEMYCWKLIWDKKQGNKKVISPNSQLLPDFLKLANASSHEEFAFQVNWFANKWGVLNLCEEHQVPVSHDRNCKPSIPYLKIEARFTDAKKLTKDKRIYSESLDIWRYYARFAKAMMNIAVRLHNNKIGLDEDWQILIHYEHVGESFIKERNKALSNANKNEEEKLCKFERILIVDVVNTWLTLADLHPMMQWDDKNIKIVFKPSSSAYGSLFANIALQFMMSIGQQTSLAVCTGCGSHYTPLRKPAIGRNCFCEQCRIDGVPAKYAMRASRRRQRGS
jgi:hypothetical protein